MTGTYALANAADVIVATNGANIAGVNAGGVTTAETLDLTGAITMTAAQHAGFTGGITAGGGADSVTLTTQATALALDGDVETYTLGNFVNSVTIGAPGQTVIGNLAADDYTIADGNSGVTTATAVTIQNFTAGADTLRLSAAGVPANYFESDATTTAGNDVATVESAVLYADSLVGPSVSFDHTVKYIYVFDSVGGTNGYLVGDMNLDGTADFAVVLTGLTTAGAFGDASIV